MSKKRIKWLDFSRGLTIFLVVIAHGLSKLSMLPAYNQVPILYYLNSILFTFIMPCFFAISGYLYKPIRTFHSYVLMIYKKGISLGIPYILFSILYVVMQNSAGSNDITYFHSYSSLLNIYSTPIDYLWFLYALFLMFIIIGIFDLLRLNNLFQFILCFVMMSISIVFPHLFSSGLEFTFNDIIYFYLGFLCSNISFNNKKIISSIKSLKMTFLLMSLLIFTLYIRLIVKDFNSNSTFTNFLSRIVGVLFLIQISSSLDTKSKFFQYFDRYGKCTLIIYLVHEPIISIFRDIFLKSFTITSLNIMLLVILLVAISWFTSVLVCKLTKVFIPLDFIFYPRKRYISKCILRTRFGKWLFNN